MLPAPSPGSPGGWAERGSCKGYPTEWWYPGNGEPYGPRTRTMWEEDAEVAKRICLELCPVRAECLVYAIQHGECGVWGGTEEKERKLRRPRRKVA